MSNLLNQLERSEKWLEERAIVDNEFNTKIQEMISDSSYIEWLVNFTVQNPKFKDTEWMYFPEKITTEDYKKVNDLDLLYFVINKYAVENHRYPISTASGKFYRIKYDDVGFIIGITSGLNVEYICSRVEIDKERDYIDFNNIIIGKKEDNVEYIEKQLQSLSNIIVSLHASGVPIESIEATIVNVINDIKPKNDEAIVKSLRV